MKKKRQVKIDKKMQAKIALLKKGGYVTLKNCSMCGCAGGAGST